MAEAASKIYKLFSYVSSIFVYKNKIAKLLSVNINEINNLYQELQQADFVKTLKEKTGKRGDLFDVCELNVLRAPVIYIACRLLKPKIVVETGVASGFSSSFILHALNKNKLGVLYSIDLPNRPGHEMQGDKTIGWLVANELKERWQLILGSSRKELPPLLRKLKEVNIFYFDSDHSYENMDFEFCASWDFIVKDGLLISDDVTENKAFDDFCKEKKVENIKFFKTGVIKKQ